MGLLVEEGSGLHDLAGLAVTALGNVDFHPCGLDGLESGGAEIFDGADFGPGRALHGGDAGTDRLAVLVDGAGSTEGHAAAELGAGEAEDVAEVPEEGHRGFAVEGTLNAVDLELDHGESPGR